MPYEKLDNDEVLRFTLDAMRRGQDAEAVNLLKTLLERDPEHVHGQYLLAAQHAQMGLFDRAEMGFRAVVASAPELGIAHFQLAQLLLSKGARDEALQILASLADQANALGAYSRALMAEDASDAFRELTTGLSLPQEIPELGRDMQRLLEQLQQAGAVQGNATMANPAPPAPSMFLTGYGQG